MPSIIKPGWTLDTLQHHLQIVSELNEKFQIERDRRYSEVNVEREKALKIKEEADKAALGLAREIQTYKDEKANQLREQITSERGSFATKEDLAAAMRELTASIQPLNTFVASAAGQTKAVDKTWALIATLMLIGIGAIGSYVAVNRQPQPTAIHAQPPVTPR
jgi:CHASE3 domain sensor protein